MSTAAKLIHRYFYQLINGCGNIQCSNVYCRSCPSFKYNKELISDPNKVAVEAVRLSCEYAPLCVKENTTPTSDVKTSRLCNLVESELRDSIDQCKISNDWSLLNAKIEEIFSDRLNLSSCFVKEDFSNHALIEKRLASTTSTTPRSLVIRNFCITLLNDEITLDFDAMRRSIQLLKSCEDEISSTMHESLGKLLRQLSSEIEVKRAELEQDSHLFNLFFIIFELSYLSDPYFVFDIANLFYSNLTNLSVEAQAKFVRVLAKNCTNLHYYISHVQQYITLHTLRWCDRVHNLSEDEELLSEEPDMKQGLDTLRMLFLANLLNGQRDSSEIIERERINYEKMESCLVRLRRRHTDDIDNDDENDRNERTTSSNENTTEASGSSSPRFTITKRPKTSKVDDTESPFENALQSICDIKPSEYRHGQLPWDVFVNDFANEKLKIKNEYLNFIRHPAGFITFSFIFYPFFLSTMNKAALLSIESRARMYLQRRSIFVHNIFSSIRLNPYFKIHVRRNHLIEDALISLEYQGIENPEELKKQLFVEFDGEQGHDEGGLSKEFFQLITEQIFSPEYGMFMTNNETRSLWFNPSALDDLEREYTLIGMLFGLAIYNSIILDIQFPPVIYRKLMGKFGTFEDIETSHPVIYKSLKNLLAFDEAKEGTTIEDAFGLTYQVAITDSIGMRLSFDLKENGSTILVTKENREEFVYLYSDLLLNKSVEKQFEPFFQGFSLVTRDSSLKKLFRPDEIDLLVAGSQVLDFYQLASAAEYDGGYSKDNPTIQNFWTILMKLSDEQKRKFLRFTTGSDRAPIGGLARLRLIISRNGSDTDRLPTAHTCFNALLLPEYGSIEKLEEKLLKAIENTQGFGLR